MSYKQSLSCRRSNSCWETSASVTWAYGGSQITDAHKQARLPAHCTGPWVPLWYRQPPVCRCAPSFLWQQGAHHPDHPGRVPQGPEAGCSPPGPHGPCPSEAINMSVVCPCRSLWSLPPRLRAGPKETCVISWGVLLGDPAALERSPGEAARLETSITYLPTGHWAFLFPHLYFLSSSPSPFFFGFWPEVTLSVLDSGYGSICRLHW